MRDGLAKDLRTLGGFMLVLGIVSGLALLLFSALFRSWGWLYLADFSKDLGIVVGAVCAVHLAYEMFLADKYLRNLATNYERRSRRARRMSLRVRHLASNEFSSHATSSSKCIQFGSGSSG